MVVWCFVTVNYKLQLFLFKVAQYIILYFIVSCQTYILLHALFYNCWYSRSPIFSFGNCHQKAKIILIIYLCIYFLEWYNWNFKHHTLCCVVKLNFPWLNGNVNTVSELRLGWSQFDLRFHKRCSCHYFQFCSLSPGSKKVFSVTQDTCMLFQRTILLKLCGLSERHFTLVKI